MGVIKKVVRGSKNIVNNYSDIEKKVRDATSVDAWMVSTSVLRDIAEATYNRDDFEQVMAVVFKRMSDSGKYWRHVLKSLLLLDYLLKNGAEIVLDRTLDNIHHIHTLKEFAYDGDDGVDHGHDIREKSKKICDLVKNTGLLLEERAKAKEIVARLGGVTIDHGNRGKSKRWHSELGAAVPSSLEDEQRNLEEAIRESRTTDDSIQATEDSQLAMALSASENSHREEVNKRKAESLAKADDLFSAGPPSATVQSDPFAQSSAPRGSDHVFADAFAPSGQQPSSEVADPFAAPHASVPPVNNPFAPSPAALAPPPPSTRRRAGSIGGGMGHMGGPQAQLAAIAKNAVEIDEFSQLAHQQQHQQQQQQQHQRGVVVDPFSSFIGSNAGGTASPPGGSGIADPFAGVGQVQAGPTTGAHVLLPAGGSSSKASASKGGFDDDDDDGSLWKNKRLVNLDEISAGDTKASPKVPGALKSTPNNPFALSSGAAVQPQQQQHAPVQPPANPFKQSSSSPKMNTLMYTTSDYGQRAPGTAVSSMAATANPFGSPAMQGAPGHGTGAVGYNMRLQQQTTAGAPNPFL